MPKKGVPFSFSSLITYYRGQSTSLECSIAPAQYHACLQAIRALRVRNNFRRLICVHLLLFSSSRKGRYVEIDVMEPSMRKIKKSGYFNFVNKNDTEYRIRYFKDMVSTIIDMKWRWVLLILNASFFLTWFLFAVLWWLIAYVHGDLDPEHLPEFQEAIGWIPCVTNIHNFTSAFMFSMENQHTTGFGARMPTEECLDAIILMCWQGIVGVTLQAAFVGLIFAKLIRPKQRTNTLLFSRNALICKRYGKLCLLIRIGDLRKSNIIESKICMQIIHSQITPEGEFLSPIRREMAIETPDKGTRFFLLWPETIVHWIDCNSPLYEISPDDLTKAKFEVIVLLEGTMDSTDQRVQARTSYMPDEILWGHNFQSMMSFNEDKQRYDVDYSLFDATNVVDTPMYSAKELDTSKPGITTNISSVTASVVLTDSSQLTSDGFEKLPDQIIRGRYVGVHLSDYKVRQVLKNGECNFELNHGPQRTLRFLQDIVNIVLYTQCCWVLLLFPLKFLHQLFHFRWVIAISHGDLDPNHLPPSQEKIG
uniref:Uncharacterized protein n=1 Tax=Timema genevievae TaxID=629358 RepID=A0A7R9JWT8_TIMGE|nr:unnamed protein product [Timema genevievae]